ncbi:hypothetical protein GQ43DRAFT_387681 [Delitschia confertaspora ATCC 74209]|uniref:Sds3-like protein n=1 Tax=Delitschia confertaspora ATCC 74209 TaxID=1513339 RepID=A0A9P4MVE3_9PLEO|nr:hypothetical protein GQ43DRAFT_387681 [Delitschia confertaspora ATCC 74209]
MINMARNRSPSPADNFPLGHSATSPQPMLSKRDKRRNQLVDKLQEMMASFSDNRDSHYRAQLAAIQADINLITKADPLANKPLEDNGEEAAELVAQIMGNNVPLAPSAGTDYVAQVGKYYAKFVESVNDAMEERDYNITMLWNKNESTKTEIENTYLYKVHLAEEEHKWLAATIRERLTASVQRRCDRLKKEKEQLDLSDSNAMLLHPSQFSITNPASPGGPQAPRKTRNRGHKFGEGDELGPGENKRKRKLFEDNENDSPGPSGRNMELGVGSPFREAKARTVHAQFEAPAYSLERLFTEKELSHAMNHAAYAASAFFAKLKNPDTSAQDGATNGTNGVSNDNNSEAGDGANEAGNDADSPPGPVGMVRQVSSNPHATRGATRSALGPASLASRDFPFVVTQPFILPANIGSKPNASAPTPAPLAPMDVDQDFALMFRDAPTDDALNERFLAAAIAQRRTREFEFQAPGSQPPVSDITAHIRSVAPHLELGAIGGVPMSAQSSTGGYNNTGANTPSGAFGGDLQGGVGMRREASGSGRRGGKGRA